MQSPFGWRTKNAEMSSPPSMALLPSKDRLGSVFENTSDLRRLSDYLSIPDGERKDAATAAEYYYRSRDPVKVRKLIFYLDCIGDTALADSVMDCAEPPADPSLAPHNLVPVFRAITGDWEMINGNTVVPRPRADLFREKFRVHNQPAEAGKYYALYHRDPNWKKLSCYLYGARERVAVDVVRPHLKAETDPSLTPANLLRVTRGVPLWKSHESAILDMSEEEHVEIVGRFHGEQSKLKLFTAWLAGHPRPTWEHVRDLLRWLERGGRGREGAVQEIEEKYIYNRKSHLMPEPLYSHQLLDDQFPGICFLGEPQEVAVLQSKPVTLSPPGLGVTFKIPPNAVQSSDEPVNVSLRTCLSTSVFQYPKGCTPLSAVYHISSDSAFKRDLELTFEHFADLETDRQARKMTFFRTECDGKGKYTFTPIVGGEFKVNGHHCTISTRHFGFVCAGSMPYSEIRKRYTVLCSYSNETEPVRQATVAISLDAAVYITNFRKALEEEWKVPLSHRHKMNVPFSKSSALVVHQHSTLKGWSARPTTSDCFLSKRDVDRPDLAPCTYPPRVTFDIAWSESARPSTLQLALTVAVPAVEFQVPLKTEKASEGMAGKPVLLELMSLSTYKGNLNIVRSSAKNYREIGSILLNDRHGHRVDIISHDKRGHAEAVMLEVYKKWLDEEEGGNCSWVTLTDCFRQCGLHHLASCTEQHFEFPLHHHYTKASLPAAVELVRDIAHCKGIRSRELFFTIAVPIIFAILLFMLYNSHEKIVYV